MADVASEEDIRFEVVNNTNISQLKLLNSVLFPIAYTDKFYRDCAAYPDVTQLAYQGQDLAGAIACRVEAKGDHASLYIMTVGVLSSYRRRGIGSLLVKRAIEAAADDSFITEAYLHVQFGKDDIISFYKQLGFTETGVVRNYYKRLQPPDAIILSQLLPTSLA